MRLTLTALGLELDITFGLASDDEESAQDPRGDVLTTAVTAPALGFGEADCAPHFFDPGEGDEDRRIGFRG